ncbi:hypothetical protein GCM10009696_19610 [Kocuria himachalensis]
MTDHADEETPKFVTFQPWRVRASIGVVFLVVIFTVLDSVPGGTWNGWGAVVYIGGFVSYSLVVNRSVTLRLDEQAVDIRQGWRKARIPYEQITEVAVGPRTPWWQIGRRRLADGSTGYLMGGPSVRIATATTSVVVSAKESYRVVGTIQRQRDHAAAARSSDTEQAGR